jgi:hypothetical protein
VLLSLQPAGWKWAQPYTFGIHSDAHTLAGDIHRKQVMHPVIQAAADEGDKTYGVEQGVIFRLHRNAMSDTKARSLAGHHSWFAGRDQFDAHRDGTGDRDPDVPYILGRHNVLRDPNRFSLDISSCLPQSTSYPTEMALTNFLYWHTRTKDYILVLHDQDDLFGTTAVYSGRVVLLAPFNEVNDDAAQALQLEQTSKAYKTLGLLTTEKGLAFFGSYPSDALFATISLLVRNTRASKVTAVGILFSQTKSLSARFKRTKEYFDEADYNTPCRMVCTLFPALACTPIIIVFLGKLLPIVIGYK